MKAHSEKGTTSRQATPQQFEADIRAFVARIKAVVTPNPTTGRAKFPQFRATEAIKDKVRTAVQLFGTGNLEGAFLTLDNVSSHFDSCQASYCKKLTGGLKGDLHVIVDLCTPCKWEDIILIARKPVSAFVELMEQKFFDLEEASRLYWAAIDGLDKAEEALKVRQENRAKKDVEQRRRQAEADRLVAESRKAELQELLALDCAARADGLQELVGDLVGI